MADSNTLLAAGFGAALGYALKKDATVAPSEDIEAISTQLSMQIQRNDLLDVQVAALTALKNLATVTGDVAIAAAAVLSAQVSSLQTQIAAVTAGLGISFPLSFGTGDPSLAGWVLGRDGLYISRVLGNLYPTNVLVGTNARLPDGGNPAYYAIANVLSVANVSQSLPQRALTIGKSVNNHIIVEMPRYIDPNMAVVLSFAEDVADDTDFLAFAAQATVEYMWCRVVNIGRKALMIMPINWLAPTATYVGGGAGPTNTPYAWNHMVNGTLPGQLASAKVTATVGTMTRFALSHRTSRSLTLRSYSVVANPLLVNCESTSIFLSDSDVSGMRLRGGAANLLKAHTGIAPVFYKPNDVTFELESTPVVASAYI